MPEAVLKPHPQAGVLEGAGRSVRSPSQQWFLFLRKNIGGLSTQPIGRTKGKAMSCSLSPQVGSAMPSLLMPLSARPNQQKPSAKSTFDKQTGPWCGSTCPIFCRVRSNAPPNCMASSGANCIASALMPQKEQSTVSLGCHLHWGMMPKVKPANWAGP